VTETQPECYEWKLRALTPLWTGDVDRKGDRLITTGLLGSIRWWLEVLVRGLGGSACDPTDEKSRCPAGGASAGEPGHHCVVCELFGCTEWARKFRFDVLGEDGITRREQIRANDVFVLRFTPLRQVRQEEWTLLDLTMRLIAHYGAIGGKTVLKPPATDYGLVALEDRPNDVQSVPRAQLEAHVSGSDWLKPTSMWPSLANFWFIGRCLKRCEFNKVLEGTRSRPHTSRQKDISTWLQGKTGESKKIFSFKTDTRTFGFIDLSINGMIYGEICRRLRSVCPDLRDDEFLRGEQIIDCLIQSP
jgi:CRISPR-associated protein Cmr1